MNACLNDGAVYYCLGPRVDGLIRNLVRNQAPPQCVQGTLLGLWVESDRENILSWGDVSTDRQIPLGAVLQYDTGEQVHLLTWSALRGSLQEPFRSINRLVHDT